MKDADLTDGTVLTRTELNGKMNLTNDGTVSNRGTESKDGLNEVDLTKDGTISNGGTETNEVLNGSNKVDPNKDGASNNGQEKESTLSTSIGKEASYLTGEEAK